MVLLVQTFSSNSLSVTFWSAKFKVSPTLIQASIRIAISMAKLSTQTRAIKANLTDPNVTLWLGPPSLTTRRTGLVQLSLCSRIFQLSASLHLMAVLLYLSECQRSCTAKELSSRKEETSFQNVSKFVDCGFPLSWWRSRIISGSSSPSTLWATQSIVYLFFCCTAACRTISI